MKEKRLARHDGFGMAEQPEFFQKLLDEYAAVEKGKIAFLEHGIRAMYKRLKEKK